MQSVISTAIHISWTVICCKNDNSKLGDAENKKVELFLCSRGNQQKISFREYISKLQNF